MTIIKVNNLSFAYRTEPILNNISFSVEQGEFVGILGPNGCGKTTLLRSLGHLVKGSKGSVFIEDKDITLISRNEIARAVSFVPQLSSPIDGFSVEEMVSMGRMPYAAYWSYGNSEDKKVIEETLKEFQLDGRRNKDISRLSGGEYQRVIIARALAQKTKILLLDEPTSHLDIKHQIDIMDLLKNLREVTVIATFHDIRMAKNNCGRLLLMGAGRIIADGKPDAVLTPENIKKVYDVDYFHCL